jgi:hypothetical protein
LKSSYKRKHGLRVFDNSMLRRIFGSKREEVSGDWSKLHNEELHISYALPNITRVTKLRRVTWERNATGMGEMKKAYKIFIGKTCRKETTRKT